jgi:hypothetical protein
MITIYVDVWKAGFERLLIALRNGFRADIRRLFQFQGAPNGQTIKADLNVCRGAGKAA